MLIQIGLNTHKRNGGLPRVVRSAFGTLFHPQTRNFSLGLPSKISTQELGRHNKKNSLAKLKHFLIFPMLGYYGRLLTGSPSVFYPFLATFVFICNSQKLVRACCNIKILEITINFQKGQETSKTSYYFSHITQISPP